VEFRYDATPPVLSVVSPQSEPRMRGVLKVAVSASDLWGIAAVTVAPDATTGAAAKTMVFNPQNGLYEAEFDTAKWLGGDRSAALIVTATDTSGYSASASLGAFVDNSAPVITKLLPGGPREGIVEFRFNVTDSSALEKVLFRRDGGEWKELTYRESRGAYYALWKTSLADNGLHVYEVRAVDALGNEKTMSYTVSIENKDYGWVIWVVLAVLAVLIVAYVAYSRRQKPVEDELHVDEPEPAPPAPPQVESPFQASPVEEGQKAPAREMPAMPPEAPPAPRARPEPGKSPTDEIDKIMNDLDK
jgi:hypothetical protein